LSLLGVAGVLELVGGSLLFLGLFTRPIAFLLSGEMAVAYFMAHAPRSFWPILNGGEVVVLFCFVWLYLAAAGPGTWSLDALWTSQTAWREKVDGVVLRPEIHQPVARESVDGNPTRALTLSSHLCFLSSSLSTSPRSSIEPTG
jgi:DoxX